MKHKNNQSRLANEDFRCSRKPMIPDFKEKVLSVKPQERVLPFVHTCTGLGFQKIIKSGKLSKSHCDVMEDERVFCFLGVPAYKYGNPEMNDLRLPTAPISILLSRDFYKKFKTVFPFDSGGVSFFQSEYDLGNAIDLQDYAIESDVHAPEKVVSLLFGNNRDYLRKVLSKEARDIVDPLDFQTQLLLELISSPERNRIDDRISTIEVQFDTDVLLQRGAVEAFIVPDIVSESDTMKKVAESFGARILQYQWRRSSNHQRVTQIIDAAQAYYHEKGISSA